MHYAAKRIYKYFCHKLQYKATETRQFMQYDHSNECTYIPNANDDLYDLSLEAYARRQHIINKLRIAL